MPIICYLFIFIIIVLLDVLNKTKKVEDMNNIAQEKSMAVLDLRKMFENNVNSCHQWFSEVEVIMSADVRLSSLNIVEDQLQKVNKYLNSIQRFLYIDF